MYIDYKELSEILDTVCFNAYGCDDCPLRYFDTKEDHYCRIDLVVKKLREKESEE